VAATVIARLDLAATVVAWFCVAATVIARLDLAPVVVDDPGACRNMDRDALRERRVADQAGNGGGGSDDGRRPEDEQSLHGVLPFVGSVARSEPRTTARSAIGHWSYYPGSRAHDAHGDPHQ
jgi:hypothetical protein